MQKFNIVETRRIHSVNPASPTGFDTLVTYANEAGRIATVVVDGESPTLDQIKQAVSDTHASRTQHAGKTFEV